MSTQEGMPADWYEDPAKVGDLRYYDGTQWTEHVTIDGVQTTAPYEPKPQVEPPASPAPSLSMSRAAQWRTEEEKAIDVVGPSGPLGRFVTLLDGAPGYRFEDAQGGTVLRLSKPSLKTAIEVSDPAGYRVGTITKIGRLHSRYDVGRADSDATATVRLAAGATNEWDLQVGGAHCATIVRTISAPADALNLAEVSYHVSITGSLDNEFQRLLLAIPLAIDILDTQAL